MPLRTFGTVPKCAMNVWRETDLGNMTKYGAPEPCGCYFDKVATGATSCTACTDDTPCGGGKCRFGYCEVR